jgi:hypothetical protein
MNIGFVALVCSLALSAPVNALAQSQAERDTLEATRRQVAEAERDVANQRRALVEIEAQTAHQQLESRQLEAARQQLAQARAELERAAREVAQLSAAQYAQFGNVYALDGNFARMRRPLLGLNIANDDDGVRVVGVSPGGPGEAGGAQIGDLIVAVDGVDVSGSADGNSTRIFLDELAGVEPDAEVAVAVLRDGQPVELTIVARDRDVAGRADVAERLSRSARSPRAAQIPGPGNEFVLNLPAFIAGRWNDMQLVELTPELGEYFGTETGLLVVRAPEDDAIDLRDGDVILEIGGRTPQSVGHAMRIFGSFEPEEPLEVTIMREQRRQSITLMR